MEEEEPKQKSEEKNDEETAANTKDETEGRQEGDGKPSDTEVSTVKKDEVSETTEYDCSTDDSESLRLFSSTDQSNCCSGQVKMKYFLTKLKYFLQKSAPDGPAPGRTRPYTGWEGDGRRRQRAGRGARRISPPR